MGMAVGTPEDLKTFMSARNKGETPSAPSVTSAAPLTEEKPTPEIPISSSQTVAPAPVEPEHAEPAEPQTWDDPETHDRIEKPTRADKRIKRLWSEREAERTARVAAEQRARDLEAQLADRAAAPPPASSEAAPSKAELDALTTAAQDRIRPKPDRNAIGTTYATYEDYVEDCAVWGGELAAEKRAIVAESTQAEQAARTAQTAFATDCQAAKADHPDFDQVTTRDLPISPAIWDATVNAPAGLKGHVLYWLGSHPDEVQRIAALPPGPALVEMGQVIATVKAERAGKPASSPSTPVSTAPRPMAPTGRAAATSDRLEDAQTLSDFIARRNAQIKANRPVRY